MAQKTEISKEEYMQVVGLLLVGMNQKRALNDTAAALAELLGVEEEEATGDPYYGIVSDAVWSDFTPRETLKRLQIKVRK